MRKFPIWIDWSSAIPFSRITPCGRCRLVSLPFIQRDVFLLRRDSNYYCFLLRARRLPRRLTKQPTGCLTPCRVLSFRRRDWVYYFGLPQSDTKRCGSLPGPFGTGEPPTDLTIQKTPKETGCLRRVATPLGKTTYLSSTSREATQLTLRRYLKVLSVTLCGQGPLDSHLWAFLRA